MCSTRGEAIEPVEVERVIAQDPVGHVRGGVAVEAREHLGERVAPPRRREEVQLRRPRGVGGVQQLRGRGELERFGEGGGRAGDVRNRQRQIEEDVAVDVREPARLAHERVAMEQHEGRLAEALHERLQIGGIGALEVKVGVAEAAVHLDGQRVSGRLVRLERGDDLLADAVEPAAIGGDRLQRGVPVRPRPGDGLGGAVAARLQPENGPGRESGDLGELLPRGADVGRRVAVVEQQQLGVRRPQERGGVLARVELEPAGVDGPLVGLAAEVPGDQRDRSPVGDAARDVRPLARIVALGEEPAELVEARRRRAQDPVRVLIDERDPAQYFSKCPCCSNAASPAE